ncbi:MAG: tetratricopeptide repeat protein [Acidobacteriota bacterium]
MRNKTTILFLVTALLAGSAAMAEWEAGVAAFKARNYSVAEKEFQEVAAKQPEWPGGHYMLGQVLLQQGKSKDALASLKKAYELKPADINYQYVLAQAYLKTGGYGQAAQMLQKINPSSLPAQQRGSYQKMLAVALDRSGNTGAALAALKKAAEANPRDATAWFNYGSTAFNSGQTAAGSAALGKALDLKGNDTKVRKAYVNSLIRLGREKRGDSKVAAYRKAATAAGPLAAGNASYDNLLLVSEAQLGAKDYNGAVTTLNKAQAKAGNDWLVHYYLAQASTSLGRYSDARASAQSAIDRAGSSTDKRRAWQQMGFVGEKLKDYDASIEAYRNAGDSAGVARVEENKRIAQENENIEAENAEIRKLEEERRKLEEELRGLPGGGGL